MRSTCPLQEVSHAELRGDPARVAADKPREEPELIGRGRSGSVYREADTTGRTIARKVFLGDWLSNLVLYVCSGAPNPYSWSRDAVRAAVYRRKILRVLVRYWFGSRLRVPRTYGVGYGRRRSTHSLRMQLIDGRHLPLRSCLADRDGDPLRELTQQIMKPLQARLQQAGFHGLVWQAGLGNPVAAGNFMLTAGRYGRRQWVWIDLESGVPALFPLNPIALFGFYLPHSIKLGAPMFDDVDIDVLRGYLDEHSLEIEQRLGGDRVDKLRLLVDRLAACQDNWKSANRLQRGVAYYVSQGRINEGEAAWYEQNPLSWHLRLLRDGVAQATAGAVRQLRRAGRWCLQLNLVHLTERLGRFLSSQTYREKVARRYVLVRIREWRQRAFLQPAVARQLRSESVDDQNSVCITDFFMQVAIKPLVKIFQYWCLPLLLLAGAVSSVTAAILLVTAGALARTAYTAVRCVQSAGRRQRVPWLALLVGTMPYVGNAAFALQLVYWSRDSKQRLGQYLLYDAMAGVGRAVPIWGGRNSLVEAWANRLPDWVLNSRLLHFKSAIREGHGVQSAR